MKKFISWAGGIVAAVISGVLVYRFTTPTPPPPPPPQMIFEGMVIDGARNAPLKDAMVTFDIQESAPNSGPYHDFTDEHGSYRKDFSGLDKSSSMVVHAQAKGFEDVKPFSFAALVDDNRHDFILLPLPAAHPATAHHSAAHPAASPAPAPTPHPELLIHPPEFIRKIAGDAIRVELQKR